jgi:hypothetical protein
MGAAAQDSIKILNRWVGHGGAWRCRPGQSGAFEVELCACTGEVQERLQIDDPHLVAHLRQLDEPDRGVLRTEAIALD